MRRSVSTTLEMPPLQPPPLVLRRRLRVKTVTLKLALLAVVLFSSLVIGAAVRERMDGPCIGCVSTAKAR